MRTRAEGRADLHPKETVMSVDHATPHSLDAYASARRQVTRQKRPPQPLPPFWWFIPSVALGMCFWIVVLALLLG
jgi:hypothetical protein